MLALCAGRAALPALQLLDALVYDGSGTHRAQVHFINLILGREVALLILQDPSTSLQKAVQWRLATLSALCAESLGVVAEALQQRDPAPCWQFRQLTRNLTGK